MTYEFHLDEYDFKNEGIIIEERINMLKENGVENIILHAPLFYKGDNIKIGWDKGINDNMVDFFISTAKTIINFSKKYNCLSLFHGSTEEVEEKINNDNKYIVNMLNNLQHIYNIGSE